MCCEGPGLHQIFCVPRSIPFFGSSFSYFSDHTSQSEPPWPSDNPRPSGNGLMYCLTSTLIKSMSRFSVWRKCEGMVTGAITSIMRYVMLINSWLQTFILVHLLLGPLLQSFRWHFRCSGTGKRYSYRKETSCLPLLNTRFEPKVSVRYVNKLFRIGKTVWRAPHCMQLFYSQFWPI